MKRTKRAVATTKFFKARHPPLFLRPCPPLLPSSLPPSSHSLLHLVVLLPLSRHCSLPSFHHCHHCHQCHPNHPNHPNHLSHPNHPWLLLLLLCLPFLRPFYLLLVFPVHLFSFSTGVKQCCAIFEVCSILLSK